LVAFSRAARLWAILLALGLSAGGVTAAVKYGATLYKLLNLETYNSRLQKLEDDLNGAQATAQFATKAAERAQKAAEGATLAAQATQDLTRKIVDLNQKRPILPILSELEQSAPAETLAFVARTRPKLTDLQAKTIGATFAVYGSPTAESTRRLSLVAKQVWFGNDADNPVGAIEQFGNSLRIKGSKCILSFDSDAMLLKGPGEDAIEIYGKSIGLTHYYNHSNMHFLSVTDKGIEIQGDIHLNGRLFVQGHEMFPK
jgi:hypothetical protein